MFLEASAMHRLLKWLVVVAFIASLPLTVQALNAQERRTFTITEAEINESPLLSRVSNFIPRFQADLQPNQVTVLTTFKIGSRSIGVLSVLRPEVSERRITWTLEQSAVNNPLIDEMNLDTLTLSVRRLLEDIVFDYTFKRADIRYALEDVSIDEDALVVTFQTKSSS
jgi:hypothetical protein